MTCVIGESLWSALGLRPSSSLIRATVGSLALSQRTAAWVLPRGASVMRNSVDHG
jgi:hypothetical protein